MNKKYCSLTFDDGPNTAGDDTMSKMLDVLEKHGVVGSVWYRNWYRIGTVSVQTEAENPCR